LFELEEKLDEHAADSLKIKAETRRSRREKERHEGKQKRHPGVRQDPFDAALRHRRLDQNQDPFDGATRHRRPDENQDPFSLSQLDSGSSPE
jgi:hypothetical protein